MEASSQTTAPTVMKQAYSRFKSDVAELFAALHELSVELGAPQHREAAAKLIANLNQPFLFVVVGEVKSGKSSFINALLGEDICRVAPDPCTDVIQKIAHAEERSERRVSEFLKEMHLPVDILKDVAIVDTPGTNSIIEGHQVITERFIPESDLVIFVFPALNPYVKSAWDFFELVHATWHKKIVFVLQQADRASETELETSRRRVAEYARERGVDSPRIFAVSAKMALEGRKDSGMQELWDFIRETVTGGRHYLLKMESLLGTADTILHNAGAELEHQQAALEQDKSEERRIRQRLNQAKETADREMQALRARLLRAYDTHVEEVVEEFENGLSVPNLVKNSLSGFMRRKNAFKDWVEDLNARFAEKLALRAEALSREGAQAVTAATVASMQALLDDLRGGRAMASFHGTDINVPAIAGRRLEVIDEVINRLKTLLTDAGLGEKLTPQVLRSIGDRTVMGGFITAIGAVIATATQLVVFDVTGGVFATIGALLAINTLAFKRNSIIRSFKKGYAEGRERFDQQLAELLPERTAAIFADLEQVFSPYFVNILEREEALASLEAKRDRLLQALNSERRQLQELMEAAAAAREKSPET